MSDISSDCLIDRLADNAPLCSVPKGLAVQKEKTREDSDDYIQSDSVIKTVLLNRLVWVQLWDESAESVGLLEMW